MGLCLSANRFSISLEKSHISDILDVCKGNMAVCHGESELLAERLLALQNFQKVKRMQ